MVDFKQLTNNEDIPIDAQSNSVLNLRRYSLDPALFSGVIDLGNDRATLFENKFWNYHGYYDVVLNENPPDLTDPVDISIPDLSLFDLSAADTGNKGLSILLKRADTVSLNPSGYAGNTTLHSETVFSPVLLGDLVFNPGTPQYVNLKNLAVEGSVNLTNIDKGVIKMSRIIQDLDSTPALVMTNCTNCVIEDLECIAMGTAIELVNCTNIRIKGLKHSGNTDNASVTIMGSTNISIKNSVIEEVSSGISISGSTNVNLHNIRFKSIENDIISESTSTGVRGSGLITVRGTVSYTTSAGFLLDSTGQTEGLTFENLVDGVPTVTKNTNRLKGDIGVDSLNTVDDIRVPTRKTILDMKLRPEIRFESRNITADADSINISGWQEFFVGALIVTIDDVTLQPDEYTWIPSSRTLAISIPVLLGQVVKIAGGVKEKVYEPPPTLSGTGVIFNFNEGFGSSVPNEDTAPSVQKRIPIRAYLQGSATWVTGVGTGYAVELPTPNSYISIPNTDYYPNGNVTYLSGKFGMRFTIVYRIDVENPSGINTLISYVSSKINYRVDIDLRKDGTGFFYRIGGVVGGANKGLRSEYVDVTLGEWNVFTYWLHPSPSYSASLAQPILIHNYRTLININNPLVEAAYFNPTVTYLGRSYDFNQSKTLRGAIHAFTITRFATDMSPRKQEASKFLPDPYYSSTTGAKGIWLDFTSKNEGPYWRESVGTTYYGRPSDDLNREQLSHITGTINPILDKFNDSGWEFTPSSYIYFINPSSMRFYYDGSFIVWSKHYELVGRLHSLNKIQGISRRDGCEWIYITADNKIRVVWCYDLRALDFIAYETEESLTDQGITPGDIIRLTIGLKLDDWSSLYCVLNEVPLTLQVVADQPGYRAEPRATTPRFLAGTNPPPNIDQSRLTVELPGGGRPDIYVGNIRHSNYWAGDASTNHWDGVMYRYVMYDQYIPINQAIEVQKRFKD
jgi:hypothetical protein